MYWNDHAPPHFHVRYGNEENETVVNILTLEITEGNLKRRARNLVLDWAELHQHELLENWELCRQGKTPNSIAPLE
jgi:Domain of unknown function (DUF4160)